jgi:DNA-directed RNA polymerase specialized sigma24 family protein
MASRRCREKRLARRVGTHATDRPPLVPHSARCGCHGCEQKEAKSLKRATTQRERRQRAYTPDHVDPEHRDSWRISGERLVDYMVSHNVERYRRKITLLDMTPEWVAHLDGVVISADAQDLDASLLYSSLIVLEGLHPVRGQVIFGCCVEGLSQALMAERLSLSEAAISRNLSAGLDTLLDIYGRLVLAEQHAAAAAS